MNENAQHTTGQSNDLENKDVFVTLTDALHRFFYFRVHDNEIADDLAQETMTRAYQTRPELFTQKREYEAKPYLYAAARHVFSNYIRGLTRHPTIELNDQETSNEHSLTAIQNAIDVSLLWKCIGCLSEHEQRVLRLQFHHGLPINQIAKKLHKSVNAVKLISSRARSKLKKLRNTYFATKNG